MSDPRHGNQGEGDKESDREYRKRTQEFVKSKRGRKAIEQAGDLTEEQARRLRDAEEEGKSRARDEDPQVKHQSKR